MRLARSMGTRGKPRRRRKPRSQSGNASSRRLAIYRRKTWSACQSMGPLRLWPAETVTMPRYFVDTFYWVALSDPRDQWHTRVLTFSRSLSDYQLYPVDEVLSEYLTFYSASSPHVRDDAAGLATP